MGVDTHLYLSTRWELDDIKKVIENRFNTKVKIRDCSKISVGMFEFVFKIEREEHLRGMYVFTNCRIPIGTFIQLSFRHDEKGVEIMRTIAKVFGGLLEENDCGGEMEMIFGEFEDSDGLTYFYKNAVLNNELKNNKDLKGLNESIHKWHDKVRGTSSEDMDLFEREQE